MARELEAKVAEVISDTVIAINAGEDAGVELGDRVVVWRFVDVLDPDSGDILGTVRLENLRLKVSSVHQRFSLARVDSDTPNFLAGMFRPSKVIVSTRRVLDAETVRLSEGDSVTVFIDDSLLSAPEAEDDSMTNEDSL